MATCKPEPIALVTANDARIWLQWFLQTYASKCNSWTSCQSQPLSTRPAGQLSTLARRRQPRECVPVDQKCLLPLQPMLQPEDRTFTYSKPSVRFINTDMGNTKPTNPLSTPGLALHYTKKQLYDVAFGAENSGWSVDQQQAVLKPNPCFPNSTAQMNLRDRLGY